MADFVEWSCAIAEAIGYSQEAFLKSYWSNIKDQNTEVINSSLVSQMIFELLNSKLEWEGTAEDLYFDLSKLLENKYIRPNRFIWASSPHALGKELNRLKPVLEQYGISVDKKHLGGKRMIYLKKMN